MNLFPPDSSHAFWIMVAGIVTGISGVLVALIRERSAHKRISIETEKIRVDNELSLSNGWRKFADEIREEFRVERDDWKKTRIELETRITTLEKKIDEAKYKIDEAKRFEEVLRFDNEKLSLRVAELERENVTLRSIRPRR